MGDMYQQIDKYLQWGNEIGNIGPVAWPEAKSGNSEQGAAAEILHETRPFCVAAAPTFEQ